MTPDVIKELEKEQVSDFHSTLLKTTRDLVKRSRSQMARRYREWDKNDMVYRGERMPDDEDIRMSKEDKPVKLVVPNNFAQSMTFTSFIFLMFRQNPTFFEVATDPARVMQGSLKMDSEAIMNRDWRANTGNQLTFQNLLNVARFGIAPMECSWTRKLSRIYVSNPAPVLQTFSSVSITSLPGSSWQTFTKYEGNQVKSVSPYRWFPDTNFPLCDFFKSKTFCASEEDFSMQDLRDLESSGEVAGVEWIKPLPRDWNSGGADNPRGGESRLSFNPPNNFDPSRGNTNVVVTKCQRWIVPNQFKIGPKDTLLGPEDFPVLYHMWIANDSRLIRAEPAYWWHNEYGWAMSQFTPDMHETVCGLSLCGLIYYLQDVISWFLNSHITSVRRVIQNRNVINPAFVEPKSYDGEGDIFMRKGIGRVDPKLAVSQLPAQDVTAGHMNDVEVLGKLMQMVSGVNDNAMGQYNNGRRSASEARVVTAGAAGRMKLHAHLIWESCFNRIGKMMLSNSRQSLSADQFMQILGTNPDVDPAQRFALYQGTPQEIVCGETEMIFDSTLSSEKAFMAQNLQDLLSVIFQANPMAAQQFAMKIDPTKVFEELQYLRDGAPVQEFYYEPGQGPVMPMPQVVPGGGGAAPEQPIPGVAPAAIA